MVSIPERPEEGPSRERERMTNASTVPENPEVHGYVGRLFWGCKMRER